MPSNFLPSLRYDIRRPSTRVQQPRCGACWSAMLASATSLPRKKREINVNISLGSLGGTLALGECVEGLFEGVVHASTSNFTLSSLTLARTNERTNDRIKDPPVLPVLVRARLSTPQHQCDSIPSRAPPRFSTSEGGSSREETRESRGARGAARGRDAGQQQAAGVGSAQGDPLRGCRRRTPACRRRVAEFTSAADTTTIIPAFLAEQFEATADVAGTARKCSHIDAYVGT